MHMYYSRLHEGLYQQGHEIFSSPNHPERLWGHKAFHLMGTGFFPLGQNRTGHEADRLPQFNAKVANEWSYTSFHPYVPSLRGQV